MAGPGEPFGVELLPTWLPQNHPRAFIFGRDGIPGPLNGFYSAGWHLDA